MKKRLFLIICCFILVLLIFGLYFPLTKTFYQQDEWMGYSFYLIDGFATVFAGSHGLLGLILGEGRILTNILHFLSYKFFPLNVFPIAIFAIIFHIINTLIVFFLAKKLFKATLPVFLGSLFLVVSSVSQSAVTWSAASINTLPSTTLILISIVLYFRYLESFDKKWLALSFVNIYVSLFFKETGIFLLLLFPITSFLYKKQNVITLLKTHWYFIISAILIVGYRMVGFSSTSGEVALFLTGSSKYFFDAIIVRAILYPLTSFSLALIPPELFLNFARHITNIIYPFIPEAQFILIAQTVVLDLLAIILSGVIGCISVILLKITDIKIRKKMLFWFVFLFSSFLPYVIISKSYSYLESRYYYLSSIAWSMIFAWFFYLLQEKMKTKPLYYLLIFAYLMFIFLHAKTIQIDLKQLVNDSQIRINIISQIKTIKPLLNKNINIFYITGSTDYFLEGNKIPFQNGIGYNLMSLYYGGGKIPKEFLNDTFLFEIGSQGYRELKGYGFGYFSDLLKLKETIKKYNLEETQVYSLYFDSKDNNLFLLK